MMQSILWAILFIASICGATPAPVIEPDVETTVAPDGGPTRAFHALDFGSGSFATYDDNLFDGLTAFTLEFWCYADESAAGVLLAWSNVGIGSSFHFDIGRLSARLNNAATSVTLGAVGTSDWESTWFHIAYRWEIGGKPEIVAWRDCVEYTQTTQGNVLASPLSADGDTFYLGSLAGASGYLDGRLTCVRLWNVRRTDAQIRADRMNPFASGPGLLVSWPMVDGQGQTVDDVSGNGHPLTRGADATLEAADPDVVPTVGPWLTLPPPTAR